MALFAENIGFDKLQVIHCNDSQKASA